MILFKSVFFRTLLLFVIFASALTSCTTEFEKIRTSGDAAKILESAHKNYANGQYGNAQTLYELAIQFYRGKAEAEEIFFKFAYTFYYLGEFITASTYFDNFGSTFYNSVNREEAEFMAAYSYYRMSPNYKLDQTFSLKAIDGFQEFINQFPNSARVAQCNDLIDEMRKKLERKSYEQAHLYYDLKYYESAIQSAQNSLKDYPGSPFEDESRMVIVRSSYERAKNSIEGKKSDRYAETLDYCNKFASKVKNPALAAELRDIIKKSQAEIINQKV